MSQDSVTRTQWPGRNARLFAAAVVVLLAFLVYRPGLPGPFLFDDFTNFVHSPALAVTELGYESLRDAVFSAGIDWPRRGLSRVTFALNHYFSGGWDETAIKATNLAIHLLNGLLVFVLTGALTRRLEAVGALGPDGPSRRMLAWLPVLTMALWLLHPLQLTGVLYAVQRMASMTATFILVGLVGFVHGRTLLEAGRARGLAWMIASLGFGAGIGFLSKQNAVLLPFFAFVVELFFFERASLEPALRRWLRLFYGATVVLPVLVGLAGLMFAWEFVVATYDHRHFGPAERLLTESRVLWFYLSLLAWPDIRRFTLHHDDIGLSTGMLDPWTTLPAVAAWLVLLVAVLVVGVRRRSPWAFAVAWFLVGHLLESGIIGLELIFEHRNYLAVLGPLFAAGYYLMLAVTRARLAPRLAGVVAVAVVAMLAFTTFARASVWADRFTLFEAMVRNHPESPRSNGQFALLLATEVGDPEVIFHHWQRAASLNAREVLGLIQMSRMLQGYIIHARSSPEANTFEWSPRDGLPDSLSSPLQPNLAYLEALDAAVAEETSRRLERGPIESSTVMALTNLRSCIQNELEPCLALMPRTIGWLESAAYHDRVLRADRSVARIQLAKLYAMTGRVEEAVSVVEEAIALEPENVHLRFELALLHIERGDSSAAHDAIARLEAVTRRTGVRSVEVERLRERLRELEAPVQGTAPEGLARPGPG